MNRNTTRRDKHRAYIRRDRPHCAHCGEPIDYDAHHRDPLSFQIDHVTPYSKGGEDTLDNLVPSHRKCNRAKGDRMDWQHGVSFVTDRAWSAGP